MSKKNNNFAKVEDSWAEDFLTLLLYAIVLVGLCVGSYSCGKSSDITVSSNLHGYGGLSSLPMPNGVIHPDKDSAGYAQLCTTVFTTRFDNFCTCEVTPRRP
jgi:hypothetical protein